MTFDELTLAVDSERPLVKDLESRNNGQLIPAILTTPFKKLALALSGGGFRAGAFSIGAMSYLNHLKYPDGSGLDKRVLGNVEFVSSASGGSLAGILYSMQVRKEIPFVKTYHQLLDFMNGQVSLEQVLETLNDDKQWQGEKSRNLINAFSKIYNEKLFRGETFNVYWPQDSHPVSRHIEVCFNATEFYRGISFRFQASTNRRAAGTAGNKYVFFDKYKPGATDTLGKVRLGDIMAASSCFPAGLEPIMMPGDFTYSDTSKATELTSEQLRQAVVTTDYDNQEIEPSLDVGLMDGGIDDNQGVYSAMLADKRRRKNRLNNGFDLIFITDVASYFMDPYDAPAVSDKGKIRKESVSALLNAPVKQFLKSKNKLVWGCLLASLILLALSVGALLKFPEKPAHDLAVVLTSTFSLASVLLLLLKTQLFDKPVRSFLPSILNIPLHEIAAVLKKMVPALKNFSDNTLTELVGYLKKTPTGVLEQMVKARVNSMLSMVLDVNLKQTRRLIFNLFYGTFYGENIWRHRRVFNVIYELSTFNIESRNQGVIAKFHDDKQPGFVDPAIALLTEDCQALNVVAESARTMGTTLWFDENDVKNRRMRDVIACGQFTTCAQLLEYALVIERTINKQKTDASFDTQVNLDEKQLSIFNEIKRQLHSDWIKFKNEPHFLADELS